MLTYSSRRFRCCRRDAHPRPIRVRLASPTSLRGEGPGTPRPEARATRGIPHAPSKARSIRPAPRAKTEAVRARPRSSSGVRTRAASHAPSPPKTSSLAPRARAETASAQITARAETESQCRRDLAIRSRTRARRRLAGLMLSEGGTRGSHQGASGGSGVGRCDSAAAFTLRHCR